MEKTTFSFSKDGTYTSKGYFGNVEGTYKLSGKTITSSIKGVKYMNYDVKSLSSDTFVFGLVETGEMVKITCKK